MYEAKLVDSLNGQSKLSHVKASDIFRENLILDEHSHQVTAGQELHEHVQEGVVLESGVELDDPRAVRLGENITLRADVSKLVLLELCWLSVPGYVGVPMSIHTISALMSDFKAYTLPSFFLCTSLTSPNAPFPMILTVTKFSGLSRVRKKRRNLISACWTSWIFACFFASEMFGFERICSSSSALLCVNGFVLCEMGPPDAYLAFLSRARCTLWRKKSLTKPVDRRARLTMLSVYLSGFFGGGSSSLSEGWC